MPSAIEVKPKSALAGLPAPKRLLADIRRLEQEYFSQRPDVDDRRQLVNFGSTGHRGSPLFGTFTEAHVLAITQAICDYRRVQRIDGPLHMGKDTHAVSGLAQDTALEVLAANRVEVVMQENDGVTPTPVISRAILVYNHHRTSQLADGIVFTPSNNPPEYGGFKYTPTHGGPAGIDATQWVQDRANDLLRRCNVGVKRISYAKAIAANSTHQEDLIGPYVRDLSNVIDLAVIRAARLKLAVDLLGGASAPYWESINSLWGLEIEVVNHAIDPTFSFMTLDHDGRIRMDCASPYAMTHLIGLKKNYQVAFANDPDAGRHGIVVPSEGLLNPNFYLAVAISYLLSHRPHWPSQAAIGKTVVTSSLIDRVVERAGRKLAETPVGFKWFTQGLYERTYCFGGEECASAGFLRRNGNVWTTDKDGLIMNLLAAEITARTGCNPGEHYHQLTKELGTPHYCRIDIPATPEQRARIEKLSPAAIRQFSMAGEPIDAKLTRAPANEAPIGGIKVVTPGGWFAVRPSAAENSVKFYAESFKSEAHVDNIIAEAREMVRRAVAREDV